MLPYLFTGEDKKGDEQEREGYEDHQKQMEDFYKQYEEKQTSSRFYRDKVGLTTEKELDMQRQLIMAQQAIEKINQQKQKLEQEQQHQQMLQNQYGQQQLQNHQQQHQNYEEASSQSSDLKMGYRRMSRSPSWAKRSKSRSRSRDRDDESDRDYRKKDRDMRRSESPKNRNRDRDMRRSVSPKGRDRDRDRDRDRGSGRDRDREHHRRRRDNRSRSRSPTTTSSRNGDGRRRRSRSDSPDRRRNNEWNPGTPSYKLAIINMPNDVDNSKITFAFGKTGYLPKDVRTMTKYDKVKKLVRTFAFVEFSDVQTAEQWMAENEGWLYLEDGRKVAAEYAFSDPHVGQAQRGDDWICANCSMNNFVKRLNCFKCDMAKEQSQELEKLGIHMVGVSPCDTLLIRGLPDGCVNSSIFDSLSQLVCLNSISMIKLSESKRFCYLQMKSADEATMLLNLTYRSPLKVKDKDVQVSYCKDSMTKLIQQQMQLLTQSVPGGNARPTEGAAFPQGNMTGAEIAAAAMAKAHAVRQASHQVGQMMTIPGTPIPQMQQMPPMMGNIPTPNFSVPPPSLGSAMPPPHMMMPPQQQQQQTPMAPPPAMTEHKNGIIGIVPTPRGVFSRYIPPNPATFMPDANSGYYVDPVTNFFFDSNTGYYYNNEAKHWCMWDPNYMTYFAIDEKTLAAAASGTVTAIPTPDVIPIPASVGNADMQIDDDENGEEGEDSDDERSVGKKEKKKKKKKDREEKEGGKKNPTDVAKEMLKWQKKQEKEKKKGLQMSLKVNPKTIELKNVFQVERKKNSAVAAMSMPTSSSVLMDDDDEEEEEYANINPHTGKVRNDPNRNRQISENPEDYQQASHQTRRGPTAAELREAMERALVDESKKMCLLCKRAFPSIDVLKKHVEKSDLHKTNLEQKRAEWGKQYAEEEEEEKQEKDDGFPKIVYRDRAKERRKQYGIDSTGYAFDSMGGKTKFATGASMRNEDSIRRESEDAAKRPLDDRNIGSRLLKNMGWKEGQGVGKNAQGIVNPIEAERFVQGAGLGSSGSKIRGGVEASHKEKTRQALFSRYHDK